LKNYVENEQLTKLENELKKDTNNLLSAQQLLITELKKQVQELKDQRERERERERERDEKFKNFRK